MLTDLRVSVCGSLSFPLPKCIGKCTIALLPRLRVLHLDTRFSGLPALPYQLEELYFCAWTAKEISPVSYLTNLRALSLKHCHELASLAPIQFCTALETLRVDQCDLVTWPDLGALASSLREVHVVYSPGPDDWSSFAVLSALTCLSIHGFGSDANVEALAGLTLLQDLTLSCVWLGPDEVAGSWQQRLAATLTCLVGLSRLNVRDARLDSLDWCSTLSTLSILDAGGNLFQSLESLPSCPALTELDLFHCDSLASLLGLQGCPRLSKLVLGHCRLLSSLEPLQCCPELTLLRLSGCSLLCSLEPLRSCAELAKLFLSSCSRISSLEPLRRKPHLTTLYLGPCSHISLEPLFECSRLTELGLRGCFDLPGLEHLRRGLPNLKVFEH